VNPYSYIEASEITISFEGKAGNAKSVDVFDRFSLRLHGSLIHAIVGPNGCGKTTLLLCLAGLMRLQHGAILIGGLPPERAKCGFVFQNYRESLFPWLSASANIAFGFRIGGLGAKAARARVQNLVESVAPQLPIDRYPYELSGGQQQLVAILRAVAHEPDLLLLDEPFASLDVNARQEIGETLERIWKASGTTTVLVSHDLQAATALADHLIVLGGRPAKVVDDFAISLPRPRKLDGESEDLARLNSRLEAASAILSAP
jgi:NitT/TauT family transport system ATP-binding protein